MQRVNIVYWEEDGAWLGYLQDYPDYWTQGETLEDLKEHLRDLFQNISGGKVPGLRKVTAARSGVSQGKLICDQLEKARASGEGQGFLRLAGAVGGPEDLSRRKGFSRS